MKSEPPAVAGGFRGNISPRINAENADQKNNCFNLRRPRKSAADSS